MSTTVEPSSDAPVLDLAGVAGSGIAVLEAYAGTPDERGVMERYELSLPEIEAGAYYRSGWWPAGGNRVFPNIVRDAGELGELGEGGLFLLLKLKQTEDGGYLALLPICSRKAYAWLGSAEGKPVLRMGTHGEDPVAGDIPLYAWARAADPYEACHDAWALAARHSRPEDALRMRGEKPYPEVLTYLGWCSWEHYKGKVDSAKMVGAIRGIERSGLPIRYVLVDNGHFDRKSLEPHLEKFADGYRPLTDLRRPDGVRWVGIWYAFLGSNHGIPAPGNLGDVTKHMLECKAGKLVPGPGEEAARAFYEYMLGFAKRDGVDFLKVDFQTDALPFYAGVKDSNPLKGPPPDTRDAVGNPLAAAADLAYTFQTVVEEQMNGLINCNWHNAPSVFFSRNSVVGRASEDYKVGSLSRAKGHLYHSYGATPWLGQTAWGDHDMFHSNDPAAGRTMAVSKAVSGGPVCLSDEPGHFAPENVRPLCYEDGELLRPLAPATPLPESIFVDPLKEEKPYRVVAPLADRSAAIVVYNITKGGAKLQASVRAEDYADAPAMMQPREGRWRVPAEGLVMYDWYAGKGWKLGGDEGHAFELDGFGDRLLHLCPIRNGWAAVGRTDKYLSPAAVEVVSSTRDELRLRMVESGPLAVWSGAGAPRADGITFTDAGRGLYRADLPVGKRDVTLAIER